MLCEGQTCFSFVGAVLAVLATHLHFYVSVWGWLFLLLGSPLGVRYILRVVALFAGKQQHLSFQEVDCSFMSFPCSPKKTLLPLPPSNIRIFMSMTVGGGGGSVVDIKCLYWLIIHGHLHKLHNAPCHFQSTADGTNVFLSGVIMTIKESSGHEIGVWWLCPVFEGLTHRRTYLFLTS